MRSRAHLSKPLAWLLLAGSGIAWAASASSGTTLESLSRAADSAPPPRPAAPAVAPPEPRVELEVRADDPQKGPADAPVTIIELSDFRCEPCRTATRALPFLAAAYPREVRLVFRPLAIISPIAAEAALAAGAQGKFWEMHDALFAYQGELSRRALMQLAAAVGLDPGAFRAALDRRDFRARVERDRDEAEALGIASTPTFVVNGRVLRGVQLLDRWHAVIREELGQAEVRR